jgi:CRISPR-associated protein Cmr3
MKRLVEIQGLNPLLFGTGKPFSTAAGSLAADTQSMPLPTTIGGAIRSELARRKGWFGGGDKVTELNRVRIRGPFVRIAGEWFFPSPSDCAAVKQNGDPKNAACRPAERNENVYVPEGIRPTSMPSGEFDPDKREQGGLWSAAETFNWLANADCSLLDCGKPRSYLPTEVRTHVEIDPDSGAHKRGQLFETEGVICGPVADFDDDGGWVGHSDQRIAFEYEFDGEFDDCTFDAFTLGGERRLAVASEIGGDVPGMPDDLADKVAESELIRLQLANPGLFANGWLPDLGEIANVTGVRFEVISACVGRRIPRSGWDAVKKRPRELKWLAPAGSVYFLKCKKGEGAKLKDFWLKSIADDDEGRRDGYALALWGVWNYA